MSLACFYDSPNNARKKGLYISKTVTVSSSDAVKLRNYFNKISSYQSQFNGLAASVIGVGIKSTGKAIGYAIGSSVAFSVGTSFMKKISNNFDKIATRGCKFVKCKLYYKYHQEDSQNGAYFLDKVTFLS